MSTRGLKPEWYHKTREMLRCKRLKPEMPGYNLLLYGICELAAAPEMGEEELYDQLQKNYMVPIPKAETKKHPVEQHMLEALRSVGIKSETWNFINDFINEVKAHNNEL